MSQTNSKKKNTRPGAKRPLWPLVALVGGGLLLVLIAVFAFRQPSQPKAQIETAGAPGLSVDKEKVDLGDVKLGQFVKVAFEITNVGDQPLEFSKQPYIEVKEGC
jgi:hypothetical protein